MIRVLVVDDSRLVRTVVREILEADPEIQVVAEAENGLQAVEHCVSLGPDVVVMDIQMPVMDGLEAVERIMARRPTPVIILSATVSPGEVGSAFRAVRAGAFEALPKPEGVTCEETYAKMAADLVARVRLYAKVGQRRGWRDQVEDGAEVADLTAPRTSDRVVALGASTGGPRAVQRLLSSLPAPFPCPVLLVQHISLGFTRGFAQWLQREVSLEVQVVERSARLRSGVVYLPLDGHHLEVRHDLVLLRDTAPVNACRPSVDVLFGSVAREYAARGVAVLLTGMGRDGAQGALQMKQAGAQVLVQDEASCIVYGMPKAAVEVGAATRVVPLREMPSALLDALSVPPEAVAEAGEQ
ncbi:MAG: chemotaxis-specific protein-glutamate methyltransferase CheB [Deferrisomatales bacterium]|nr:chemotaxis-specific protein-glutamate methyltransferase CheB [Deferrisomatales bacterium]